MTHTTQNRPAGDRAARRALASTGAAVSAPNRPAAQAPSLSERTDSDPWVRFAVAASSGKGPLADALRAALERRGRA